MHCVAVAQAVGVEAAAVVVDAAGAVNDFIAAVAVHVGNAQVVVALTFEGLVFGLAEGVEVPAEAELLAVEVVG